MVTSAFFGVGVPAMRVRRRSFLTSRRVWLTQVLLERLRALREPMVSDAALRFLADATARRLAEAGGAYGKVDWALQTAPELINAVAALERPHRAQPVSATLLQRLAETRRLPRVAPWL